MATVREIMTSNPATATLDTTLEELATMMKEHDTGAIPVLDGEELAGIVTDRDIVIRAIAEGKSASECSCEEIISGDPQTIEPEADAEEAARIMSQRKIRRLAVVEDGELVGMLSLGDIAVKEGEDVAGDALQDVSEGVKQGRAGRKRASAREEEEKDMAIRSGRQQGASRSGRTTPEPGRSMGGRSRIEAVPQRRQSAR